MENGRIRRLDLAEGVCMQETDSIPVTGAQYNDLLTINFQKYRVAVAEAGSLLARQNDHDLLENSGFTNGGTPTLAGLLLLAELFVWLYDVGESQKCNLYS